MLDLTGKPTRQPNVGDTVLDCILGINREAVSVYTVASVQVVHDDVVDYKDASDYSLLIYSTNGTLHHWHSHFSRDFVIL